MKRNTAILAVVAASSLVGKEGYLVKLDNNQLLTPVTGATDSPIGVVIKGDVAGAPSSIALPKCEGTQELKLNATPGTVKLGTLLMLADDGTVKADAGTGARVVVGQALESGAAGEIIECQLNFPIAYAS